jgi:type II secretory pathway predicted ATPase ExeA
MMRSGLPHFAQTGGETAWAPALRSAVSSGILAGQPTLNRQVRLGMFAALDQRIATRFSIKPIDLAESATYLRHHLAPGAGREEPLRCKKTPRSLTGHATA